MDFIRLWSWHHPVQCIQQGFSPKERKIGLYVLSNFDIDILDLIRKEIEIALQTHSQNTGSSIIVSKLLIFY